MKTVDETYYKGFVHAKTERNGFDLYYLYKYGFTLIPQS